MTHPDPILAITDRLAEVISDADTQLDVVDGDPLIPFRVLLDRANGGNPEGDGLVVTIRGLGHETSDSPDLTPPPKSVVIAQSTSDGVQSASQVLLNYAYGWTATQQVSWFRAEHGVMEVAVTSSALRPPEPGRVPQIFETIESALS